MPTATDATVLGLVRLALGTARSSSGIGPIDVDLFERATRLGVLEQVMAAAAIVGVTEDAASRFASAVRARALRGVQAEATAWRIHQLARGAGVPSLLLKGVALAVITGRDACERTGVDTDVLVRPEHWPRLHDVLTAAGYRLDERVPPPRPRDSLTRFLTFSNYEAAYTGPGGPIDVHWRLVPGHTASLSAAALFARAVDVEIAGAPVATLDPDAMLAHVALHGAKDHSRSARTLVDAHLLVTVAGAGWSGAAALVGRSPCVRELQAAVEDAISGSTTPRRWNFGPSPSAESLPMFLRHRVALTPTAASVAAVAAGMMLPRQVVAGSRLPRAAWWLLIVPRTGRAAWWAFRGVVAASTMARPPDESIATASPTRPSTASRIRRDITAVAHDLARWFAGAPSGADTYRVARKMHVRTAGVSSAALVGAMRAAPGAADHVRRGEVRRARGRSAPAVDELRRRGIAILEPVLDDEDVARLRAFAEHAPARLTLRDGRVVGGTYGDRHPDTVLISIPGMFAWADPRVQRVMASERLHAVALARFGLAPVVHVPNMYWSCVPSTPSDGDEAMRRALRFHMDYDGVLGMRVHLYLTDVDEGSAPMEYVTGSHRVGALRGRRFRAADRGLDEFTVTERFGPAAARCITGSAGTTFVTDPRGLHRATPPQGRDRLFLVMPIQAGSFAGAVHRRRAVPVRDEGFRRILDTPGGPLRLFDAITDDPSSGAPALRLAQLSTIETPAESISGRRDEGSADGRCA